MDLGDATSVKVLATQHNYKRFHMKDTLFTESLKHHQDLIDHILKYKESDGICRVSQKQLMLDMRRNWMWITKAIDRINTEEICIKPIGLTEYIILHESLSKGGVFARIFLMLADTYEEPSIIKMKDADLMAKYGCKLKTVQMYRAYATSGWKKYSDKYADMMELVDV